MSGQNQKSDSSARDEEPYESVQVWELDKLNISLEIGLSGVCNHCDTDLVENPTADSRLQCPDCGYLAGLVIRMPQLKEGGEPGENGSWPGGKEDWEIDDGRATFDLGFQGTHTGCGTFVDNIRESRFGVPTICCDECGSQFERVAQINTLVDPVNDINHLEGRSN